MGRKPRKSIAPPPEAELSFMQKLGKQTDVHRKRDNTLTRSERVRAQNHVEQFIASRRSASFPVVDADVHAEQAFVYTGAEPLAVLLPLIESAIKLGDRPPPLGAQMIATLLFGSYDDTNGCDVRRLRAGQLTVERVLAHVTSLPVRLEPRVAFAVARRATQVLLNAAPPTGTTIPPGPPATEPEATPPVERESDEPEIDEELCVECGATYQLGAPHRCASAEPPPAPRMPEASRTLDVASAVEQLAAIEPKPIEDLVAPAVLVPPLLLPTAVEVGFVSEADEAEAAAFAEQIVEKMAEPVEDAPPEPESAAPAFDKFWDGRRILVLDFTGKKERPVTAPVERAHREHAVRQVIGWARTRTELTFFFEEGIGKDGHFEALPPGTLIEVLKPDDRDQHDKEYRKTVDQKEKREPRQLVVVRWHGGISLLWGSEIEAVGEAEYNGTNRQEAAP